MAMLGVRRQVKPGSHGDPQWGRKDKEREEGEEGDSDKWNGVGPDWEVETIGQRLRRRQRGEVQTHYPEDDRPDLILRVSNR